jgi:hypothetical protein
MVLERFNLEAMALKLNPDDPTQALPGAGPGEIEFGEDFGRHGSGQVLAIVILDGSRARVLVKRIERLIRVNHRRDFVPRELGIWQRPGAPDLDVELDLTEVIQVEGGRMRTALQRVLPPASRPRRPPHAIRAFGSSR